MSSNSSGNRDSGTGPKLPASAQMMGRKSTATASQIGEKRRHSRATNRDAPPGRRQARANAANEGAQFISRKAGLPVPSGASPGTTARAARYRPPRPQDRAKVSTRNGLRSRTQPPANTLPDSLYKYSAAARSGVPAPDNPVQLAGQLGDGMLPVPGDLGL